MDIVGQIIGFFDLFKDRIYVPAKIYCDTAKKCEDNLNALEEQIEELKNERDSVQDMVHEAESYMRVANEQVKKWFELVDERISKEHDRLIKDRKRAKGKLLFKWCPHCMTCHELSEDAGNAKSDVDVPNNDASKDVEKQIEKGKKRPEDDGERAKEKLFFKWRPHCMTRHDLSMNAVNAKSEVQELINVASEYKTIQGVSKLPPPAATQQVVPSNDGSISSRKEIVDKIVRYLKIPGINKVGVHGMGGIGKTVLAKEVCNRVLEEKLFHAVVMCPLPRKPSIRDIQQMIIDDLGLKIVEKKESVVATRLLDSLKKKNVLVILDNLWKPLDLRDVGIPIRDQDKGCKILLTSRELNILSENGMSCQKNIPIPPLSQKEAEDLFKRIAGNSSADYNASDSTAREIVLDCAGLPVSIVAAAKGLKKRPLHVWKSVRRKMIGNTMKQEEHSSIEMSYKLLESTELQSAFVLCSQMANNCSIRDFLKFAIALDVFDEFLSVEEAQDEVRSLVLKLREASLLLGTGTREEIVMHDVVRDVGQSIASRECQAYTRSQEAELRRWPRSDRKRICLYCHIVNLPKELNYPELEFLVIDGKDRHLEAGQDFKLETEKLKVLALYRCSFSSLPSFKCPNSLATLCLDGSKLGGANIDTIEKLQNLEILSFVESDIKSLPAKLGELSKLRILDLSDCSKLEMIPPNVISRLTSLEELYMGNSFSKWQNEGEGQSTASLAELKKLSHLTNLEIHIPEAGMMPEDLFPGKLERYSVTIGPQWGWGRFHYRGNITPWHSQNTESEIAEKQDLKRLPKVKEFELDGMRRLLKLKLDTSILEESYGVRKLVRRAEVLHLEELGVVENNLYDLDGEGFPELKHLNVSSNSKIKYIVNARKCASSSFPQLESLILKDLVSLEKICHEDLRARSLCNLKDLQVECCSALKNLLSITTAQKLFNLESITVKGCESLEEIVAEERDYSNQDKQAYENAFSELRFLDLRDLPNLRNFYSEDKKLSEENSSANEQKIPLTLFHGKIVFSKLEALTLHSASKIQRLWHDNHEAIVSSIQNLKRLTVEKCDNLEYLFTSSMVRGLKQLEYLSVRDCDGMKEIIVEAEISGKGESKEMKQRDEEKTFASTKKEEGKGGERSREMVLPELSTLLLENLKILKRFCTGVQIDCPMLKRLEIKSCEKLETFISKSSIAGQEHGGHAEDPVDTQSPKSHSDQQPVNPQSQNRSLFKFPLLKGHARAQPALKQLGTVSKKSFKRQSEGCDEPHPEKNLQSDIQPLFDEKVSFPGLEEMQLFDINHKEIWHKEFTDGSFCDLKKLTVTYCGELQRVFPSTAVERFKRLDNLVITDCKSLVEIFELSEKDKAQGKVEQQEKIKKRNTEEQFQLRRISLRNLERLKSIWKKDPMGAIILKNLQSVEAVNCPSLKNIFPFSIAEKLEKLEELKITDCEWVEHVIGGKESVENLKEAVDGKVTKEAGRKIPREGDGKTSKEAGRKVAKGGDGKVSKEAGGKVAKEVDSKEVAPDFWFPSLTSMTVTNLPKLRTFYPGDCTLECPPLKVKVLKDCGGGKFSKLEDLIMAGQLHAKIGKLPSSSGEKAMGDLKSGNKETHVSTREFLIEMASTVKTLKMEKFEVASGVVRLDFFQKFPNLEKLVVRKSSVFLLFSCEGILDEQGNGELPRLRNLELSKLDLLECIWEEDYRLDPLLQYLETLDVRKCRRMRVLLPFSASFKNLTSLEVNSCNRLRFIMTSSTARSLVQLKRLNVQNCFEVEEIVAVQGDEINDAIIFSRLVHLGLVGLAKLFSFSGDSCTFIFPSMKEVTVGGCCNMRYFSRGLLSTPKLDGVRFKVDSEDELWWKGDLNSTIKFRASFMNLDSSAQDSPTAWNNKVTELSDADSDDVPLVRKIKRKEDSILLETEAEMVHQAPSGEIEIEEEVVGSVPTTNNFPAQEPPTSDESIVPFTVVAETSSEKQGQSEEVDQPTLSDDSQDTEKQPSPQTLLTGEGKCHGVPQSELPTLTRQSTSDIETVLAEEQQMHTEAHPEEQDIQDAFISPKIAQKALAQGSSHVIADDMEDTTSSEESLTSKDMENHTRPQIQDTAQATSEADQTIGQKSPTSVDGESFFPLQDQKDPPEIAKDELLQHQAIPKSPTTVGEELNHGSGLRPTLETPTVAVPKSYSPIHLTFENLFASIEEMINSNAASRFQPPPGSNTLQVIASKSHAVSSETYDRCATQMKQILSKSLSEVARSTDASLLLFTLKNLKERHFPNSEQSEIIQVYIEKFDTLVTNYPFYEQQIDWAGYIKFSIEDGKKRIAEIKSKYEDLRTQTDENEVEEDSIRASMEVLYSELVDRTGKLKTHMNTLREAERQQKEAEERAREANDYWTKLRSFFS